MTDLPCLPGCRPSVLLCKSFPGLLVQPLAPSRPSRAPPSSRCYAVPLAVRAAARAWRGPAARAQQRHAGGQRVGASSMGWGQGARPSACRPATLPMVMCASQCGHSAAAAPWVVAAGGGPRAYHRRARLLLGRSCWQLMLPISAPGASWPRSSCTRQVWQPPGCRNGSQLGQGSAARSSGAT